MLIETDNYQLKTGINADPGIEHRATLTLFRHGGARVQLTAIELRQLSALASAAAEDQNRFDAQVATNARR